MDNEDPSARLIEEASRTVAVEIYKDVVRPAAREAGYALETIFKVGLSPMALLDWGFEQSKSWLRHKVEQRLSSIPEEYRRTPPQNIAVPALTSISMSTDSVELRELYAELLMKAMDTRTEPTVHPSYINLIGQLTPQEAMVLISFGERDGGMTLFYEDDAAHSRPGAAIEEQFARYCIALGFNETGHEQLWLENLQRLKLVVLREYSEPQYVESRGPRSPTIENNEVRFLELTEYGRTFVIACKPLHGS